MRLKAWVALGIALAGTAICLAAVGNFFLIILQNRLAWSTDQSIRQHYLAVGSSFTQGFAVGFFLCLSLALIAVVCATWRQHRVEQVSERVLQPDSQRGR